MFISICGLLYAFYLQIELNLIPCTLCMWQRWPHVFNILITLILLTTSNKKIRLLFVGFSNMLGGTFLSIYHFGLEEGFWNNIFSCSGIRNLENLTAQELLSNLKKTPISSCETVQWHLFDISLAGWNIIISSIITIIWALNFYLFFSNQESNSASQ